jgi:ABC-2 type transport system ATP-binding protein
VVTREKFDRTGTKIIPIGELRDFIPRDLAAFPETWKSAYGETTRDPADGRFTVRVPLTHVVAVSQEILTAGTVADITIEDVPLEDVIAELFSTAR